MRNEFDEEVPDNITQKARDMGSIKPPRYIYKKGSYNKLPAASIGGSKATRFKSIESANANKVELGDGWVAFKSPSHAGVVLNKSGGSSSSNDSVVVGGFDGADGLWKSLEEHREQIYSRKYRDAWDKILSTCLSFEDKNIHVFSRRDGFSCIISGLKVLELKFESGNLELNLYRNIHKPGKRSVSQEKTEIRIKNYNLDSLSTTVERHLLDQLATICRLRENNSIGYMEKWLHTILIEHFEQNKLDGLDLDFLYYEVPLGKVKRNKQFGREKADIFARDSSGSLVVIEVKENSFGIDEAIRQGLHYVEWVDRYKDQLKDRVNELEWGVDLESLKLYVIAPGYDINQKNIKDRMKDELKNYDVSVVLINNDWYSKNQLEVNKIININ